MRSPQTHNERGIALIMVMLLTVAVAALAAGAIFLTSSASLVSRGQEREEEMRNAADAGIEYGRSTLNGGSVALDTIYHSLVLNQPVNDANGVPISGITRSIYYGPTGSSTGQYGIFASIVSVITDRSGAVVVRRGELAQESFAKFAYYTDNEGSGICFGNMDNIFGPLHTNDDMCIYSSGARFRSTVEVSGSVTGQLTLPTQFDMGYTERGAIIPMPTTADLAKLNIYATQGGMSYVAPSSGSFGSAQARLRIEFMALDLDGDGRVTGPDEGFYRVYEDTGTANASYVTADVPASPSESRNCGHYHAITQGGVTRQVFVTGYDEAHPTSGSPPPIGGSGVSGHSGSNNVRGTGAAAYAMSNGNYRCFLGGDDRLFVDSTGSVTYFRNAFHKDDLFGRWVQYTATPDARVVAALASSATLPMPAGDTTLVNRQLQAQYLFPLSRAFNPNSKGVIYVTGRVAISGVLQGRLTLASNDNVIIADDMRYAIPPGSAPCVGSNILGLLSPDTIFLADNTINSPWDPGTGYKNYDDTNEETLQGVLLTLASFYVENHGSGSTSAQPCQTTTWGRGCLSLTGGIIQRQRGAVGLTSGTGYVKRYAYDNCAFQTPPPYFPTTGRYLRNRYYEIDPVGFNVANFYASLTPN